MARDDRIYAFIIAHTPTSSIRRFCVATRSLKLLGIFAAILLCGTIYGLYGLTQQAEHLRTEIENQRLKAENQRQRQELMALNSRVEAVEDTSRKLAEKSGVVSDEATVYPGAGGPALPVDANSLAILESKMAQLERNIKSYESVLRERGYTPSVWPIVGKLESGFGGRRNPFGGSSFEFHSGQDIDAKTGDPVIAGARGTVTFTGWQNGYGQLVVVDHGGGLTTRYGHLSHIDVTQGQTVERAQFIGRVGSTGRSTGPHLHYEIRINDEPVNPLPYLLTSSAK
jgi:murein DD-endopeptidase MepM/ murein hydrolase activator NlpD